MQPRSDIILLVMAAGEASRMGSIKQLLPVFGIPLIDFQIHRWRFAFRNDPIVVTGAYSDEINQQSKLKNVKWLHNKNWNAGLGSSIITGVEACAHNYRDAKACMLILLDQVHIGPSHLIRLIEEWCRKPGQMMASEFDNAIGPPVIFPRQYWTKLSQIEPISGAGSFLYKHTDSLRRQPMPEAAFDLDLPADYDIFLNELKFPKIS